MRDGTIIGFIGLGVMGEPICRNMARKSGLRVLVSDLAPAPVARLVAEGAEPASLSDIFDLCDIVALSLPGGAEVEAVLTAAHGRAGGQIVIDMSTSPVGLTRALAARLAPLGIRFADAPVARTRAAAIDGTLSIMVGADADLFADIRPLLAMAATEVSHCGPVGCGQAVKILNNMVLFETVVALSEALTIAEAAGVDRALLLDTLSKGSADSFALRNHGLKAMVPDSFPLGAFSTDYALKDVGYALALARDTGVGAPGAELARARMEKAAAAGFGAAYFPALMRVVDRAEGDADPAPPDA